MSRAELLSARATLVLYVGARHVDFGVREPGRDSWTAQGTEPLLPSAHMPQEGMARALAQVAQQLLRDEVGIGTLRAVVSDTWLMTVTVPWSTGLMQAKPALAYAAQLMDEAGFEGGAGDVLRIDDAPHGLPRLAVAYPAAVMAALDACAQSLACQVSSVLPLSRVLWQVGRGGGPLALLAGDEMLLLSGTTRLEAVSAHIRPEDRPLDIGDLDGLWARQALRAPRIAAVRPRLLDLRAEDAIMRAPSPTWDALLLTSSSEGPPGLRLAAPAPRRGDPLDAVRPRQRPGAVVTAVLATLATCAMAASWSGWQIHLESGRLADEARQRTVAPTARPTARKPDKEQIQRLQAVNTAAQQLDMPFHALLKALQPARDIHIAVLGVDFTAAGPNGRGRMNVLAEAASAVDMTRYVGFIDGRWPLGEAYMTHHDQVPVAGGTGYRFSVEVSWSE